MSLVVWNSESDRTTRYHAQRVWLMSCCTSHARMGSNSRDDHSFTGLLQEHLGVVEHLGEDRSGYTIRDIPFVVTMQWPLP